VTLDPYRTLGLEAGASTAEVKRAYRRLAKAFHPDSAGEAALPRFLAIHEAYEAIKTGRPMGATRAGPRPAEPAAGAPASEPWRADPARARAARERARSGRGGRTGGAGSKSRASGTSGTSGTAGSSGTSSSRGRRGTRKATLGSTSYDEARDPADATWSGASWYGPSSGEYWIINPREYADPRKHGPEYQSRARKMAAEAEASDTVEDEAPFAAPPPVEESGFEADVNREAFETRAAAGDASRSRTRAERAERADRAGRAAHATSARHTAPVQPAGPALPVRPMPGAGDPAAAWDAARIRAARTGWRESIADPDRDWLSGATDDPVRRFGVALVAWPPIGLAAAAAIGELTGCSVYAATCGGTDSLLPWLAQAGILGLLLLLPALARLLAGGTVAILLALVPVTAFLLVVGGAGEPEAGFALTFLLGMAWVLGVAGSIVAARRRGVPNRAGGAP
jgi:hypothetical protein